MKKILLIAFFLVNFYGWSQEQKTNEIVKVTFFE